MIQATKTNARKMFSDIQNLFEKKLEDYGTSDIKNLEQVLTRMNEKIERIRNLQHKEANNESVLDNFFDIAGYAVIGGLFYSKQWGEGATTGTTNVWFNNDKVLVKHNSEHGGINTPAKQGDCGYDLIVAEDMVIEPHGELPVDVPCNVSIKIPEGYWAMIINRSSTTRKLGLRVVSGVIDNGYTGPLYACVYNMTNQPVEVKKGMRLAQLIFFPLITPACQKVDELPKTERGEDGFGSTG